VASLVPMYWWRILLAGVLLYPREGFVNFVGWIMPPIVTLSLAMLNHDDVYARRQQTEPGNMGG